MIDYTSEQQFLILFGALMILIIISTYIGNVYITNKRQRELETRLSQAGMFEIDQMSGSEFELFLAILFQNLGYRVTQTPASNDYGADLILEGMGRIVVQAKRYKNKVGVKAVQEINTARDYYGAQEAWVITNNLFSTQAANLASSSSVRLIDRLELSDLIIQSQQSSLKNINS
jgi:restriction system protein